MSQQSSSPTYRTEIHPRNCWYAVATTGEVGREPLGRRVLGTGVVLFRTTDGTAVALEDRCAHRPYPLSLGRVDGDRIVSGYTGFTSLTVSASMYPPRAKFLLVPGYAHFRCMKTGFLSGSGWVSGVGWPAWTTGNAVAERSRLGDPRHRMGNRR